MNSLARDLTYIGKDEGGIEYYFNVNGNEFQFEDYERLFQLKNSAHIVYIYHERNNNLTKSQRKKQKEALKEAFQKHAEDLNAILSSRILNIILKDKGVLIEPEKIPSNFFRFYRQKQIDLAHQDAVGARKRRSSSRGRKSGFSKMMPKSRSRSRSRSSSPKRRSSKPKMRKQKKSKSPSKPPKSGSRRSSSRSRSRTPSKSKPPADSRSRSRTKTRPGSQTESRSRSSSRSSSRSRSRSRSRSPSKYDDKNRRSRSQSPSRSNSKPTRKVSKKTTINNTTIVHRPPEYRSGYRRYDDSRAFINYFYQNPTYYPRIIAFLPGPVSYDPVTRQMLANQANEAFMQRLYEARPDFGIDDWIPVFEHYQQLPRGNLMLRTMSVRDLQQVSSDITGKPYVRISSSSMAASSSSSSIMQSKMTDEIRAVLPSSFPFPQPLTISFPNYFARMRGYKTLYEKGRSGIKTLDGAAQEIREVLALINSRMRDVFPSSDYDKIDSFMHKLSQYTERYLKNPLETKGLNDMEQQIADAMGPFGLHLAALWKKPSFGYSLEKVTFPTKEQSDLHDDVSIRCILANAEVAFDDQGDYIEYYKSIMEMPFIFKIHRAGGLSLYSKDNNVPNGFSQTYETTKIVPRCHVAKVFHLAISTSKSDRSKYSTSSTLKSNETALVSIKNEKFLLKKQKVPQFFDELANILSAEMEK